MDFFRLLLSTSEVETVEKKTTESSETERLKVRNKGKISEAHHSSLFFRACKLRHDPSGNTDTSFLTTWR